VTKSIKVDDSKRKNIFFCFLNCAEKRGDNAGNDRNLGTKKNSNNKGKNAETKRGEIR
jgi:hypothetical protein